MRKMVPMLAGLAAVALLSGCATHRGLSGRAGPDEFAVAREAPLVIPPDYALTPPQPGAARPQDVSPANQALDAMFGGPAQRSASEAATLDAAGDQTDDPGVPLRRRRSRHQRGRQGRHHHRHRRRPGR